MIWTLLNASPPLELHDTITSGMSKAPIEARRVTRRLRSDAAANRERILAAATIAVRRDCETVPMATIADEAGVGIGTLYRHYPTRPALLAALTLRSFQLVLQHARAAALSDEPAPEALEQFFEQTIAARNEFILPLHGGPVIHDEKTIALQTEIRNLLERVLARGRRDRTIRPDATPTDIIITGAMLAQHSRTRLTGTNSGAGKPGSSSQASLPPTCHCYVRIGPRE
jgi:AcrR family transcriptional regulator